MTGAPLDPTLAAAAADLATAVRQLDGSSGWRPENHDVVDRPLGAEVWLFDPTLRLVLLVEHAWRGWVPAGGRVEEGETPRQAAIRELREETGVAVAPHGGTGVPATVHPRPAATEVRSYQRGWAPTLSIAYSGVAPVDTPLTAEPGQAARWTALSDGWRSVFPDDVERLRWHASWLAQTGS